MTEQPRDVAAEFMAATTGGTPAPQPAQPSGAPAGADREYATAWGTTRDPAQAWAALQGNSDYMRALMDGGNPAHKEAVAQRSELFRAMHGEERGDIPQGETYGEVADGVWQEPEEVTEEQMQAAYSATATGILERQGLDAETAQSVAEAAVRSGMSTLEINEISQAVSGSQCPSPEAAIASLGDNAAEIIRAAQQEAHALGLPADLLDLPVGEHLVLGEHPALIKALARRRGVR
jgi:hypothetical protein